MKLSKEEIQEYFCKLNPIASKIMLDIDETKSSYEHIWHGLNAEEQTHIINETLIKPEIALRYFDNFSSSSSSSSLCSSGKDDENSGGCTQGTILNGKIDVTKKSLLNKANSLKKSYGYDGRTMSSYFQQKTGLKLIHDDVVGIFRDEHSTPFAFKTKSQMNLCSWEYDDDDGNTQISIRDSKQQQHLQHQSSSSPGVVPNQVHQKKYKKASNSNSTSTTNGNSSNNNRTKNSNIICKETKSSAGGGLNKSDATNNFDGKYERLTVAEDYDEYDDKCEMKNATDSSDDNLKSTFLSKFLCKNSLIFNTSNNLIIASNQLSQEEEEGNLLKNLSISGLTSSSSVPSEEEEDKQTYEESKLLLENDNLRKGFDFLNNW